MPKFEQAGTVYGPDVEKPTVEDLENENKDIKIKNRPDGNTIITTGELPVKPKGKDEESMEEVLKKNGIDSVE